MTTETTIEPRLELRRYGIRAGDYQMVSGWLESRDRRPLPETVLPSLGVIVEADGEGAAALWVYMDNSIGVCFIDCAATRPDLGLGLARRCMEEATRFLEREAAGLGYGLSVAYVPPAIARFLEKLGYEPYQDNLIMMGRRID